MACSNFLLKFILLYLYVLYHFKLLGKIQSKNRMLLTVVCMKVNPKERGRKGESGGGEGGVEGEKKSLPKAVG